MGYVVGVHSFRPEIGELVEKTAEIEPFSIENNIFQFSSTTLFVFSS
jgi:hypothetical protein